ncbi:unnamed protein product [Camellia sinensis]
MNMGDTDYSMSTTGNVPNRADSTKTRKKGARPAEGIPSELSEMAKNFASFIENTNTTMVEIAHRIGYSHDLSQQRRLVNVELLKLPMSNTQRLMTASMIVKDEDKVDLFLSLDENDKMEWVSLLFEGWRMQAMLLVNPHSHQLKLCDFGSAKMAPELIFGATEYTTAIDMWSTGWVLTELLLGQVFNKRMPAEAVDLVSRLLQYSPNLEACAHPFFDDLREPTTSFPNGRPLPPLFNFTSQELAGHRLNCANVLFPSM